MFAPGEATAIINSLGLGPYFWVGWPISRPLLALRSLRLQIVYGTLIKGINEEDKDSIN